MKRSLLMRGSTALLATVWFDAVVAGSAHATDVRPAEARAIAKEAYIYGYALVDSYRIQYAYFADKDDKSFKSPWNQLKKIPEVYTPADTTIQMPNSDTPYSFAGLDLRAEPIVISVPQIEKKRYYSIQFIDAYTFNFAYAGSRTTGNGAASFLIAGPNWKGTLPKGLKKVIRSETDFNLLLFRTQLFDPADIDNVKKVQAGYKVQPLSAFAGAVAPSAAPAVDFVKALTKDEQKTSLESFNVVNFVLGYSPTVPSELKLRQRFARIGVEGGKVFDPTKLSPEIKAAVEQGRADAWQAFAGGVKLIDEGKLISGDLFGTREFLKNDYPYRWLATIGIYGNSKQEAIDPVYRVDANGQALSGASSYRLRLAKGQLPPVNASWSLTMYELPQSLLVANPINRYLINSRMLPQMTRNADGGLTLYVPERVTGQGKAKQLAAGAEGAVRDVHAAALAEAGGAGRQLEAAAADRTVAACPAPDSRALDHAAAQFGPPRRSGEVQTTLKIE